MSYRDNDYVNYGRTLVSAPVDLAQTKERLLRMIDIPSETYVAWVRLIVLDPITTPMFNIDVGDEDCSWCWIQGREDAGVEYRGAYGGVNRPGHYYAGKYYLQPGRIIAKLDDEPATGSFMVVAQAVDLSRVVPFFRAARNR